jgi:hypothetical protein
MDFYYFGGHIGSSLMKDLDDANFTGVLFTYDAMQGDFFTRLARDIKHDQKIKYMIAIRPYAISPQYLCMVNQSINEIMPDRLQINLISGHVKPHEQSVGGILGDINDSSSNIDRSNYLIKYVEMLEELRKNPRNQIPDYYVSTTNRFVFDASSALNSKMIIAYRNYRHGCWVIRSEFDQILEKGDPFSLDGTRSMISLSPIIRKTQEEIDVLDKPYLTYDTDYFTYEQFDAFVKKLESDGVKELMLGGWPESERNIIIKFVKEYTENNRG